MANILDSFIFVLQSGQKRNKVKMVGNSWERSDLRMITILDIKKGKWSKFGWNHLFCICDESENAKPCLEQKLFSKPK